MEEKKYVVKLIPEAQADYKKLDGSVKKDVNKKIDKLQKNPFAGVELGNKNNVDLTSFYKLYACNKSIRIVYRFITPEKIEIIEIWGIGKREKSEIYKIVGDRITNHTAKQ
ncbi:MAG: type II toxin-antitoxin system RelE family toxin [Treponema sp.]